MAKIKTWTTTTHPIARIEAFREDAEGALYRFPMPEDVVSLAQAERYIREHAAAGERFVIAAVKREMAAGQS